MRRYNVVHRAPGHLKTVNMGLGPLFGSHRRTSEVDVRWPGDFRLLNDSYGYAIFPSIGEGGLDVGGAHGKGRVYVHGRYVSAITMSQVSVASRRQGV